MKQKDSSCNRKSSKGIHKDTTKNGGQTQGQHPGREELNTWKSLPAILNRKRKNDEDDPMQPDINSYFNSINPNSEPKLEWSFLC